ncbi:MAG: hypothetical protein RI935_584 [Candidatus Parcubacteria bacterium]|jgi:hypothetical protein
MNYFHFFIKHTIQKGFILPFTMLLVSIILLVVGTGATLLSKQLYFSKVYRQSQTAYYAADDALMCTLVVDDTYLGVGGHGIFPGATNDDPDTYINDVFNFVNTAWGFPMSSRNDIQCAQVPIFQRSVTGFEVSSVDYEYNNGGTIESGKTSTFTMRMPTDEGGERCAKVTVHKTLNFRQIIAQGYATCDSGAGSIERAIVNTTITE